MQGSISRTRFAVSKNDIDAAPKWSEADLSLECYVNIMWGEIDGILLLLDSSDRLVVFHHIDPKRDHWFEPGMEDRKQTTREATKQNGGTVRSTHLIPGKVPTAADYQNGERHPQVPSTEERWPSLGAPGWPSPQ